MKNLRWVVAGLGAAQVAAVAVALLRRRSVACVKHRAVFQVNVDGEQTWLSVLANVENLRRAFGCETTKVEVVCFGSGIGMLVAGDHVRGDRIAALATSGVVFAACRNTLTAKKIGADTLLPAAVTVDSGVAEIVRKQEHGWSYIRGG